MGKTKNSTGLSAAFRVADAPPPSPYENVSEIALYSINGKDSDEGRLSEGEAVGIINLTVSTPDALAFFAAGKIVTVRFEDGPDSTPVATDPTESAPEAAPDAVAEPVAVVPESVPESYPPPVE